MKKLQLHIIFLTALLMSSTCHADPVPDRAQRMEAAARGETALPPAPPVPVAPVAEQIYAPSSTSNGAATTATSTEISPVKKPSRKSVSELNAELNSALKKYPSATQLINSIKKSINKSALSYAQLATTADKKIAIHEGFEKGFYGGFFGSELPLSDLRSLGPKCYAVDTFRQYQDIQPPYIPHLIRAFNTSDFETAMTTAPKSWLSGKSDIEKYKMILALATHGNSINEGEEFCKSRMSK
jgi:hypothetical protein